MYESCWDCPNYVCNEPQPLAMRELTQWSCMICDVYECLLSPMIECHGYAMMSFSSRSLNKNDMFSNLLASWVFYRWNVARGEQEMVERVLRVLVLKRLILLKNDFTLFLLFRFVELLPLCEDTLACRRSLKFTTSRFSRAFIY